MHVKTLPTIATFVAGVALVFTLVVTINFFKTNTAHGDTTQNLVVYADQLSGQFSNWSWGSFVNLSNNSPVYAGTSSISFTPLAWGALYFHSQSLITTSSYNSLQFAIQSSEQKTNFSIIFYDNTNQSAKAVNLAPYVSSGQNGWMTVSIPASVLPATISGFAIQDISGTAGPTTYVDSVQFVAKQTSAAVSSQTSSQSTSLYTDSLASGWIDWSWNSTVAFSNSTPVYQGSSAIAFTPKSAYGGFYIHSDKGIDTTPYQVLTFAIQPGVNGQKYAVAVYDTNNQQLHAPIALDTYGSMPAAGSWKVYTIPLADLNATNKTIKGMMIQDTSGAAGQILYIDQIGLSGTATAPQITNVPVTNSPTSALVFASTNASGNPLSGMPFFNDPDANPAQQQVQQWQSARPTDAAMIAKIANQPKAIWMGGWNSNIQSDAQSVVTKASAANALPVFVAYNIPGRDCGSYSAGGTGTLQAYESWIQAFAKGIGQKRAAVILEPDALAQITCLSSNDQSQRYQMLSYAVQTFKSLGKTSVYLDAGNANWIATADMATRLKQAGIAQADGFSLNVSNFMTTADSVSYGQKLSQLVGNKHFVIDTSRNGNGPTTDNAWCNPAGRALGSKPTTQTGNSLVDAYLWIKYPGESDGTCNGAPAAGIWYSDYALGLAQRASW